MDSLKKAFSRQNIEKKMTKIGTKIVSQEQREKIKQKTSSLKVSPLTFNIRKVLLCNLGVRLTFLNITTRLPQVSRNIPTNIAIMITETVQRFHDVPLKFLEVCLKFL